MSTQPKAGTSAITVLAIIGGVLLIVGALVLIGSGVLGWLAFRNTSTIPPPSVQVGSDPELVPEPRQVSLPLDAPIKVFDRAAVKQLMGKTKDDVHRMLGQADVFDFKLGGILWIYHKRTRDPETGTLDLSCTITVDADGKVTQVSF